ncbi:UDP-glycosyltransferase 87A2 [Dichanthelium oligosanthes]|uniref:Glycosyltransferase n=1 Tax=Dichanthelium oligosanthes TaxID=888268 RepID=A0A1E5W376_9POAL|nr:UDP-glycosyltransferase 87A2 [Dichanthelium oligosanthes]
MGSTAAPPCHLVAVPYPGRGHVNAMLNLCSLLAARDGVSAITVVVTDEWLGLLGAPAALPELGPRVRFEAIPNVIPSEHGRASDMVGFLEAVYAKMAAPFERLLDRLAAPQAIVADMFVPWTVAVGARRGVPVCVMCPLSATMFAVQYNFHRLPPAAVAGGASPDGTDPCLIEDYIPGTKSIRFADLAPTHTNAAMLDKILEAYSSVKKAQCIILTSFQELEIDAIGALRQELPCPVYAVGPCIPFMALQEHKANPDGDGYMTWLDAQPAGSVLYVSLGSFLSVSAAQFDEIAAGLAESKARFLWVLRDTDARSRVRGVTGGRDAAGLVVPWTNQLRVLCHPSVGGFFTHCGMNSTLEAVYAGVPMLTLPIAFDQPTNSRLVTEVWKTGLGLKEMPRADGVIGREEIAAAVERLMCPDPAEAADMRKRAALLKDAARAASEEGGSSWKDVTSFIDFISH